MNKAKIVGALMASVLAAVPVANIAGNIFSFNDNAIVAVAATTPNGPYQYYPNDYFPATRKTSYTVNFEGSLLFEANEKSPIMESKNLLYKLFFKPNGSVVICRYKMKPSGSLFYFQKVSEREIDIFHSDIKGSINPMLAMQWDGNIVVYANHDYRCPMKYTGQLIVDGKVKLATPGNKYEYSVSNDGRLIVKYNDGYTRSF